MTRYSRTWVRRQWLVRAHHAIDFLGTRSVLATPIFVLVNKRRPRLWVVPLPGTSVFRLFRSPGRAWKLDVPELPEELRTQPGIRKDSELEREAHMRQPLYSFAALHENSYLPAIRGMWPAQLFTAPTNARAVRKRIAFNNLPSPTGPAVTAAPEALTAELRSYAGKIGLSAIGITEYQPKYNFKEYHGLNVGNTVIVCLLEQNYDSTQMIPSVRGESTALATYGQLEQGVVKLARWLRRRGYAARPEGYVGESLAIAYAVEAGLGQLGLNGQLLTPEAGSRTRIHVMTTNATLELDHPVDYGIEGICDRCRICVERCPAGAIPAIRKEYRGVTKAKLNTKRCLPILGLAAGCGVCMKVCPVQRFGVTAVVDEYKRTGRIIGKGSDDLEGYDWPVDGQHYGVGARPRIEPEVFQIMPDFDPSRTVPRGSDAAHSGSDPTSFASGLS
jgi:epoxyqueuosine reductase